MRLLHDIVSIMPFGYVWAMVVGLNGRPVDGVDRYTPRKHIWRVERGTIPPVNHDADFHALGRRYWTPYRTDQNNPEWKLTPLCGRLSTRSRSPRWRPVVFNWENTGQCVDCLAIAARDRVTPTRLDDLVRNDPWTLIRRGRIDVEWWNATDPVSGL